MCQCVVESARPEVNWGHHARAVAAPFAERVQESQELGLLVTATLDDVHMTAPRSKIGSCVSIYELAALGAGGADREMDVLRCDWSGAKC